MTWNEITTLIASLTPTLTAVAGFIVAVIKILTFIKTKTKESKEDLEKFIEDMNNSRTEDIKEMKKLISAQQYQIESQNKQINDLKEMYVKRVKRGD